MGLMRLLRLATPLMAFLLVRVALIAQQTPPAPSVQPYPVLRTERVGTGPPLAKIFKVFQFPADKIPRIDGDDSDWAIVPDSYTISLDQMQDDHEIGRAHV